jgi:hypothetical protein
MKNKQSINIFPALTFGAGFFAGYKESSGVDLSPSVEFLTKYAPTAFAMITTSGFTDLLSRFSKNFRKGIQEDTLVRYEKDPIYGKTTLKKYSDEKFNTQVKISSAVHKLERTSQQFQENKLEKTIISGAITGATTLLGYWTGSAFAMSKYINY